MKLKKILLTSLLSVALVSFSSASFAQENSEDKTDATETSLPSAPKPENNWLKICEPLDSGEKACIMRQIVLQNGQFFGSFMLRNDPGQENKLLAVAAVPLGVLLPFNMVWQIDGGKPIRVPFVLCDKVSCTSQLVINENYINSLKKGSKLSLSTKTQQNKDLVVNINLAGFTSVYDNDTALTFDQFREQSTGASALEQQLQDRAEQIRQNKN
ncbi:MAG: invasion associated locus B family protein [Devosiaceae bacterium]|nr:invasion associated locus B family protein [Devosiaceae bacterium]